MAASWVYIVANWTGGTTYVGVTSDLVRRVFEHRSGSGGFTRQYRLTRLVYFEEHASIEAAIQREKNIKHWPCAWKVALIERANPSWDDLWPTIL